MGIMSAGWISPTALMIAREVGDRR